MPSKFFQFVDDQVGLQVASLALLLLAVIPVCIGSYASLQIKKNTTPSASIDLSPAPTRTSSRRNVVSRYATHHHEEETHQSNHYEEERTKSRVLTCTEVACLPVMASLFVYATNSLIQYIHPDYLNKTLAVLTSVFSFTVFSSTILLIAKSLLPTRFIEKIEKYNFSFSNSSKKLFDADVTAIHMFVYAISIYLAVAHAWTKHWVIGNLFASCISIQAIQRFTVDSFATGMLLLGGMLAYDLLWVFGTNVLVVLSKVFPDAPTSIVWPRNIKTYIFDKVVRQDHPLTMFGLGEIIIPGIYIAYCLRVDKFNWLKSQSSSSKRDDLSTFIKFPKPYFYANLLAYIVSAAASIYTVHYTKKAQSAFVFIVPALAVTTIVTGAMKNELGKVFNVTPMLNTVKRICFIHPVTHHAKTVEVQEEEEEEQERPSRFRSRHADTTTTQEDQQHNSEGREEQEETPKKTTNSRARSQSKSKKTTRGRSRSSQAKKSTASSSKKSTEVGEIEQHVIDEDRSSRTKSPAVRRKRNASKSNSKKAATTANSTE